jgi:hypothetical protein
MVNATFRLGVNGDVTIEVDSPMTFNGVGFKPAQSTVANLPAASAHTGETWYATNGRNSAEGAAAGTGCNVRSNGTVWMADWSGLAVTA